jgi:hypothetical protein
MYWVHRLLRSLKRLLATLPLLAVAAFFIVSAGPEWPAFQDNRYKLDTILGQRHFDFLVWETNALAAKGEASLAGGQMFLDDGTRKATVLEYLDLLNKTRRLEAEIARIYADPEIADPAAASAGMQQQVDEQRAELERRQPLVESIVQEQVSAVLVDEGFDLFGSAWPPVQMHMTPLPYMLIVSPRDEIRQLHGIALDEGIKLATREEIESAVYDDVDLSALVVGIGGVGMYPSMIVETGNINFLADVVAHEWTHHWLTLHPLGFSYLAAPELRTINETVSSMVGAEVGAKVIERFYPEFVPEPEPELEESGKESSQASKPAFDFRAEMGKTRVRVDELLTAGRVEEAEEYMEERRRFLWENGYRIRKINQAYFAFYGAYADVPGQRGEDPIGPTLLTLREQSPSLRAFMDQVGSVTSLEDLQQLAAEPPTP